METGGINDLSEITFTIKDADLDNLNEVLKDVNVKECPYFEVQDKYGNVAKYYREGYVPDTNVGDTISRQAAIDAAEFGITYAKAVDKNTGEVINLFEESNKELKKAVERIKNLPSAESEPAIPLSWIEGQIKWLKSLDNAFSTLTAVQISAMVNKWRGEQNEID